MSGIDVAQLRAVGKFFAGNRDNIDVVVGLTFQNLFKLYPDAETLFQSNMNNHQHVFSAIFLKIIELTRTCHLWPVSVQTGNALLPGLEHIRERHSAVGITRVHFSFMKTALFLAMEQKYRGDFTPDIRIAFAFVYDVLAKSLYETPVATTELVPLSKLSHVELAANQQGMTLADMMEAAAEMTVPKASNSPAGMQGRDAAR